MTTASYETRRSLRTPGSDRAWQLLAKGLAAEAMVPTSSVCHGMTHSVGAAEPNPTERTVASLGKKIGGDQLEL